MENNAWVMLMNNDTLIIILMAAILLLGLTVIVSGCQTYDNTLPISANTLQLAYTPVQCVDTPWQIMAKNSSVRWIMAPTDEQMITTLYAEKYHVNIQSVKKIKISDAACMACYVCGTDYGFEITVDAKDKDIFLNDGWKIMNTTAEIANPASVNCIDKDGNLTINDTPKGQVGYCTLPSGKICEEWALFRGTCS